MVVTLHEDNQSPVISQPDVLSLNVMMVCIVKLAYDSTKGLVQTYQDTCLPDYIRIMIVLNSKHDPVEDAM